MLCEPPPSPAERLQVIEAGQAAGGQLLRSGFVRRYDRSCRYQDYYRGCLRAVGDGLAAPVTAAGAIATPSVPDAARQSAVDGRSMTLFC